MNQSRLTTILAAGAAILFMSAASALDKVTVAYFLEWPTANQVAQLEKTYDEAMGVEVEWRAFGNGNEMSQAMASGDVHIAYSQGAGSLGGRGLEWPAAQARRGGGELRRGRQLRGFMAMPASPRRMRGTSKARRSPPPIGNVTHYKLLRMLDHLGVRCHEGQHGPDERGRRGGRPHTRGT